MGKLFGLIVIFLVGMAVTALLTVAWMMVLTYGKKKVSSMETEDWDAYFARMPVWGYVVRGLLFLSLALWVSIPMVYAALRLFHYDSCGLLSALFGFLTAAAVVLRTVRKRKYLLERINALK